MSPAGIDALTSAALAGRRWKRAAGREQTLRAERDAAIRAAAESGVGVRELARAVGIDPAQVHRIIRAGD